MPEELLILVDEEDNQIGVGEKQLVHEKGLLHRCFSLFIFNSRGELLLQKRADGKYHCGGLWTNTCCSHPRDGETLERSIHRRLKEEMGFDCPMEEKFHFIYKSKFDNGLTEHEFDHAFVGKCDIVPEPDEDEVSAWQWISIEKLKKDIKKNPHKYTPWLKIALERL